MRSVLTAAVTQLKSHQPLMALIEDGGLWDMTQPPDTNDDRFPTVILGWAENDSGSNKGVRLGMLTVDIWDEGSSSVRAEAIRDEVEIALDRCMLQINLPSGARQWVRFFIGSEAQVPTESTDLLVHWTMDFDARYFRQAFVERLLS